LFKSSSIKILFLLQWTVTMHNWLKTLFQSSSKECKLIEKCSEYIKSMRLECEPRVTNSHMFTHTHTRNWRTFVKILTIINDRIIRKFNLLFLPSISVFPKFSSGNIHYFHHRKKEKNECYFQIQYIYGEAFHQTTTCVGVLLLLCFT
jgi:hypothetical protein